MPEEEDQRIHIIMAALLGVEYEITANRRFSQEELKVMTKLRISAIRILAALDNMNKRPKLGRTLTGDELWESIVDASKP